MKNLLFTIFCLAAFTTCKNSSSGDSQSNTTGDSTFNTTGASVACYIRAEGQDTTFLSLTIQPDGSVSGQYDWVPWQKDGARGTLTGKQEGELLKLIYDYTIEGSNQKQEIILRLSGNQLEEGQGELTESPDGVLRFKDPSALKYLPLARVDCK